MRHESNDNGKPFDVNLLACKRMYDKCCDSRPVCFLRAAFWCRSVGEILALLCRVL